MREFYFYSERPINNTIKEVFTDFKIHTLSKQAIKENNFTNKNILLILNEVLPITLNNLFFLKNNIVIFFLKNNNIITNKFFNIKIFEGHISINKFSDEVTTFFDSKMFVYEDIKIDGKKIINSKNKKEVFLTSSEKDILILLFERKRIEKNILLENVLRLRGDINTKTMESHLTRIRKKLLFIESDFEIILKDNIVFLLT